ncbi:MAG: hypothetical protein ABIJ56_08760 [Pseudomonadota bacterium]
MHRRKIWMLFTAVLLPAAASSGTAGVQPEPNDLFRAAFYPLEKTMGITINPSKLKLSLLTGKVKIPKTVIEHPVQGKFAVIRDIEFPIGLLLETIRPEKAVIQVGSVDVSIDLGNGKFWDSRTSDGKPIPGAPNLKAGAINFKSVNLVMKHGKAGSLRIEGAEASLMDVNIPAADWSRGDAPMGVWAKAKMKGGQISFEGLNVKGSLDKLDMLFNSEVMFLKDLQVTLPGRGRITASGNVDCIGAEPKTYDLSLALDGFKLMSKGAEPEASGTLKLAGKKGGLKIKGELKAGKLETMEWQLDDCVTPINLDIRVLEEGSDKKKIGSISGNLCKGNIIAL